MWSYYVMFFVQKLVKATLQTVSGGVRLLVNDENERAFKFYTRLASILSVKPPFMSAKTSIATW